MKRQSLFSLFGGAEKIDEAANMKDSEALPVAGVATGSEDSEGILPVPVPLALAIAVPVPVVVVAAEIVAMAGATASVVATLPVALAAVAGV